jgi:anthranilate phosphoribosyltransferase
VAAYTWSQVIGPLLRHEDLEASATAWAMEQILSGAASPAQLAGFVIALRSKGETVTEVEGLVSTMRDFATRVSVSGRTLDVVGTGGDQAHTVNISTMSAIVAAGAGAKVVKHGNRAASSACGAADVLEALGVVLDLPPERQAGVVTEVGIGFLFAPLYHPALRHAVWRRELGIPTTFNFLGPLANPAQPVAQAVGVADVRMATLMAGVFAARGQRGLVVHGGDGLDELTTTTTSTVWVYADGTVRQRELDPAHLGIPRAAVSDLVGGDAATNAGVVRDLLDGRTGPVRDIVTLNAAAALVAYDGPVADDLEDQLAGALTRARDAIDSGAGKTKLEAWVASTRS